MAKKLSQILAAALLVVSVTGTAVFAQSTIENTGPGSTNEITNNDNCDADINNDTDIDIDNNNDQDANSGGSSEEEQSGNGGSASNNGNTTGGDSDTGDATNDNNTDIDINVDNSTGNPCNPCDDCDEETPTTPGTTDPTDPAEPSTGEVVAAVGGAEIAALPYTAGESNILPAVAASIIGLLAAGTIVSRSAVSFLNRR